ncbi:hypothetical protein CC80DRAFT_549023 [Byssothecium circinans]|uniref:Uncharacterized protein n=1 Tax=Byssothecium circinans TaxID=147558 RepID=A0A6A5TUJ0_9PLEO|nr:hypothetical protein CC80DRAFT_549023 [Byssothecium circinans]
MAQLDRRLSNSKLTSSIRLRTLLSPVNGTFSKIPPSLRNALHLLHLRDLDALENHFLALEAFLKPWCHFRDTFFLLCSADQPRASSPGTIRKTDVLRFYTNFLHGELRYDPRADDNASQYTDDETKYGTYDNSHWAVQDYEKLMYAWILQEFKVGKMRNPYGFKYFELKNQCTAWEEVIEPIVQAVRDSYDVRGRYYYGRLAKFIEARSPSRLAFPESNVVEGAFGISLPTRSQTSGAPQTPFRLVSFSKGGMLSTDSPVLNSSSEYILPRDKQLTEKEIDEVEVELRNVAEKYGGMIERPKFKTRIDDWLAVQKERVQQRHLIEKVRGGGKKTARSTSAARRTNSMFGCRGLGVSSGENSPYDVRNSVSTLSSAGGRSSASPSFPYSLSPRGDGFNSPTNEKKAKKDKEAVVPYGRYGYVRSPTKSQSPKTPDGVPRRIDLPDTPPSDKTTKNQQQSKVREKTLAEREKEQPWTKPVPPFAKPNMHRQSSDGVYTSIRNSNPFAEADRPKFGSILDEGDTNYVMTPINDGPPSAIPKPLFNKGTSEKYRDEEFLSPSPEADRQSGPRHPSYAGNGYEDELTPDFIAHKLHATLAYDPEADDSMYAQRMRKADRTHAHGTDEQAPRHNLALRNPTPQAVPWPRQSSLVPSEFQSAMADYDSSDSSPAPPIPAKNPRRADSMRRLTGGTASPEPSRILGPRIISKENIRAHLSLSRESSRESLARVEEDEDEEVEGGKRDVRQLNAFNKHMFPRRDRNGIPVGVWMGRNV